MRAFLVLLLGVLSLVLLIKFYPSSTSEAADPGAGTGSSPSTGGDSPRFLRPPDGGAAADSAGRSGPTTVDRPAERGAEGAPAGPPLGTPGAAATDDGGVGFAGPSPLGGEFLPGEVAVAEALAHGGPADVERALARVGDDFPDVKLRLARALAAGIAGDVAAARTHADGLAEAPGLSSGERALLAVALGAGAGRARPASFAADGVLAFAAALALRARESDAALAGGDLRAGAEGYSDLLQAELDAPWGASRAVLARWSEALRTSQAGHRWHPRGAWPSDEVVVQDGDSLTAIRVRWVRANPGKRMCVGLIRRANRIRGDAIQGGQSLRVPTDAVDVLVDLSARWMLYRVGGEVVDAYEVAIGRPGEETIVGTFTAGDKIPEPPWTRVGYETVPYGDPDNPLGTRWITWLRDGKGTGYGFHGTWEPERVGQAVSDGCVRLRNEEVEQLFEQLPMGAPIHVRE